VNLKIQVEVISELYARLEMAVEMYAYAQANLEVIYSLRCSEHGLYVVSVQCIGIVRKPGGGCGYHHDVFPSR
jgi:hypothetical protein